MKFIKLADGSYINAEKVLKYYSEYGRRWRAEHPDYHRQWLARQNESVKE